MHIDYISYNFIQLSLYVFTQTIVPQILSPSFNLIHFNPNFIAHLHGEQKLDISIIQKGNKFSGPLT